MFSFLREIMAPTTRSATAQQQQEQDELQTKDDFEEIVHTMEEFTSAAAAAPDEVPPPAILKGFKVTDNERSKKYGLGANSLQVLKTKAKLKFPIKDLHIYMASNGFEVTDEEYFSTLESQTLLIVAGPDVIVTTDSDFEFEQLRERLPLLKVADIVYEFMEQQPEHFKRLIAEYERKRQGQEEKCHTKEEALARKAQDRVRGYYYKSKDELTRNRLYRQNPKARKIIDSVLEKFRYLLIGCDYFSMMFDRKHEPKHDFVAEKQEKDDEPDARSVVPNKKLKQVIKEYTLRNEILDEWSVSLCTDLGDFYCQGGYSDKSNDCALQHTINPYASRENLILFQVWNLDHQIELCRTILPSLLANVKDLVDNPKQLCQLHQQTVVDISVLEYFLEIFSLKNLKLVHVVCHEKVQRQNRSNGRLLCPECHEYKIVEELMAVQIASTDEKDF